MENVRINGKLLNKKGNYSLDREASNKKMTGFASVDKPWLKYYSDDSIKNKTPKKTIYRYAKDNNKDNEDLVIIDYYGFKKNYKEFFSNIDKVANSFKALGVKKGDIVTICSPTFPETIYANYALNKIGAIANNIDPRNNASRIKDNLNMVESDYLIMLDIAYPKINSIINDTKVKKVICNSFSDSVPPIAKPIFNLKLSKTLKAKNMKIPKIPKNGKYIKWDQFINLGKNTLAEEAHYEECYPAAMVLTGGTTGFPKSVVLTNDSALAEVESYKATDLGLEKGQSLLNIMPGFIAYGWTFGVVMAPALGIKDIIIPQFDINEFPNYIIKNKPNHIVGVPTHYTSLMRSEKMKNFDFSGFLKSISAGGDHFFVEDEESFNTFLHKHGFGRDVIVGFGLTEANSSIATRLNKCNKKGSAGIPLLKNTISIFKFPDNESEKGTDIELPYGEVGEICQTGENMMQGYYKQDEKTKEVQIKHSDGKLWTHTKDRGYMTKDGVLYTKGRTKRMIIRPDGHNVWPDEMENIIMKNNNVESCVVIGIPSKQDTQGEYPRAVVVLKDSCTETKEKIEQDLRNACNEALPERDIPYSYSFIDSIPLTNIGKVDFNATKEIELKKETNKKTRIRK